MSKKELEKRVASLESQNDHLQTELDRLDQLMRTIGFTDGLATVRATAEEIIDAD